MAGAAKPRPVELPRLYRSAALLPATLDADGHTLECCWSTGARVRRQGFWDDEPWLEELSLEDGAVDLVRLNKGAPVLDSHQRRGVANVLGAVVPGSAYVADGEGRARLRLSERPDVAGIVGDIRAGIIRNLSVSYEIEVLDEIEPADRKRGTLACYRATRWAPTELSFVAVGADAGAQVRGESDGMRYPCQLTGRSIMADDPTAIVERPKGKRATRAEERPPGEPPHELPEDEDEKIPPAPPKPDDDEKVQSIARAAERKRMREIRDAVRAGGLPDTFGDPYIDDGIDIGNVRTAVLAELAKQQPAVSRSVVEVRADGLTRMREGMFHALLQRIAPHTHGKYLADHVPKERQAELLDAAKDWHGRTLMELGRACLEARGFRQRGVGRMELAAYALGLPATPSMLREGPHGFLATSDFPTLLATVGRAQLTAGYTVAPRTFPQWTRQGTLPDFRATNRVSVGAGPKMLEVMEHAEYLRGSLGVTPESMQLKKYGRILAFTLEAMINDDVGLFNRIPVLFGNAAAAMESDVVYGILTSNPTMADGFALFSTQHGNLMTAGPINVTTVAAARAAMLNQKTPDGQYIGVAPRYMIVGPSQEVYALQFLAPITIVGAASDVTPSVYKSLELVVEPRITDLAWYLAASPGQIDTIEYDYLEGAPQGGPTLQTREGWDIDGQEYKAREEFGAKALDYRGLVKNPGALPTGTLTAPAPSAGEE